MHAETASQPQPAVDLYRGLPGLVQRGLRLDPAVYRDKVLGCWHGKNIGGTLGGPLEEKFGRDELFNVDWYPDLPEGGIPNDDIELQLLWLQAIQEKGPGLTARELADYWLDCVRYNFDEYGLHKANLVRGLQPPVSGWHNNWFRDCMGSPIRSEIWACLAPGTPEIAARYAFEDAICDHGGGESVYGEIFNAVMQSCAFVESDRVRLVRAGLSAIPAETQTARAIDRALEYFLAGIDWVEARNRIKQEFYLSLAQYSPINMGFQTIGFLYGRDFADAICKAVNCGWDTDCTGATVGATLGIILGAKQLPAKWLAPLRDTISTNLPNGGIRNLRAPTDVNVLTDQVCELAPTVLRYWGSDTRLEAGSTAFPTPEFRLDPTRYTYRPNAITFDLQSITASIEYGDHAAAFGHAPTHFVLRLKNTRSEPVAGHVEITPPPGWASQPERPVSIVLSAHGTQTYAFTLLARPMQIGDTNRGRIDIVLNERPALPSLPLVFLSGNRWLVSPRFDGEIETNCGFDEATIFNAPPPSWTERWRSGNDQNPDELFAGRAGVVYLLHWIHSPQEQEVIIGVSNNQRMKLWLNGAFQHATTKTADLRPNQGNGGGDGANYKECILRAGWNQILIKLERNHAPVRMHFTLGRPDRKYFKCLGHAVLGLGRAGFPWER